jgi:hypothetical protein
MRRLLASWFVAAIVVAACAASGANPVGTWKGKFHGVPAKFPGKLTPESKKAFDLFVERMKSMRCTLKVKADHTFINDLTGTEHGKKTKSRVEGKWQLTGSTLVTTNLKRNGSVLGPQSQVQNSLTLSKDGKTLTEKIAAGQSLVVGEIVLKRQ